MRVAVYGTKHDASLFEELLKEASQFQALGTIGDTMIDTACLNIPKVGCVALCPLLLREASQFQGLQTARGNVIEIACLNIIQESINAFESGLLCCAVWLIHNTHKHTATECACGRQSV